MVDKFTVEDFENALPVDKNTHSPLWKRLGIINNEYCYLLPVDDQVGIMIRSSISRSGVSADSGEDSIRAWLVEYNEVEKITGKKVLIVGKSLGSKVSRWTTRVTGWQDRLINNDDSVIRTLWRWRKMAGDCSHCGKPKKVFKVNKHSANRGRIFAKCPEHNEFVWLTEAKK